MSQARLSKEILLFEKNNLMWVVQTEDSLFLIINVTCEKIGEKKSIVQYEGKYFLNIFLNKLQSKLCS